MPLHYGGKDWFVIMKPLKFECAARACCAAEDARGHCTKFDAEA